MYKERNDQIVMDVSKARQLLTNLHMSLEDPVDAHNINVNGVIGAVSRMQVELSIGIDDGVRVRSGTRYLSWQQIRRSRARH